MSPFVDGTTSESSRELVQIVIRIGSRKSFLLEAPVTAIIHLTKLHLLHQRLYPVAPRPGPLRRHSILATSPRGWRPPLPPLGLAL